MEALIALLVLFLFAVLVVLPIWSIIKIGGLSEDNQRLKRQFDILEAEVENLRTAVRKPPATAAPKVEAASVVPTPAPVADARSAEVLAAALPPPSTIAPPPLPPELPARLGGLPVVTTAANASPKIAATAPPAVASVPVPPPVTAPVYVPPPPKPGWLDSIDWEQFMGVKLFAWLGGLALFLGVAFFIKYSFDHDLIPRAVRAAIGFVFGAGLVVGGLKISREKYAVTAQTLIATGVVSLYGVTFACRSIYHFEFFGPIPTFLLMSLITATAFILAVRLEAQVIAILGILGGFLTPKLLSTGVDNPGGLFGYVTLLDIGLVAVALHRSWFYLAPLGATGTIIMMVGWANQFYAPEKTVTAMAVCLGFCALFIGAVEAARRRAQSSPLLTRSAMALPLVAFGFAWFFLGEPTVAINTELFFGFVILVSVCVFILSWREEMGGLIAGAAGISALLMVRWAAETFTDEQTPVVVTVCLVFSALYFAVYLIARRLDRASPSVLWSAVGMPLVSLAFALFLMDRASVGDSPALLFTFIFVCDALLLALAWLDDRLSRLHLIAGLIVFGLLSVWTSQHLTNDLLLWALAVFLLFAVLHTAFPLLLQRHRPNTSPTWWSQLFPPLALLLMLLPIFKFDAVSLLIWPAILLVDLIAILLAALSASLIAVGTVLVLTLLATGLCIFKVPVAAVVFAPSLLFIIGGFTVFFFAASLWLVRKLGDKLPKAEGQLAAIFGDARSQIPAFSSLLPFLLLIMVCVQLPIRDPSAVFGLGLLLVVLTLGLAQLLAIEWLSACALIGVGALEFVWHARRFNADDATLPLVWYVSFYAVFGLYPFLFRRNFEKLTGPWAVAALSGLVHFWMSYQAIKLGWPDSKPILGLVPALFALAPLASLIVILRTVPVGNLKRLNQLAWFGGVALFFITLIFPIQFEDQPEWLTVAWALEGAALLWLFIRVPHPGLRVTGVALLVTAFVRLALNPAVFDYHVRGDTAIFNWYFYTYGLATAALFIGAKFVAPPRERVLGLNTPPLLNTLGVILAFFLLNIEIADYFTMPGSRSHAFKFSGDTRDMVYTIAWSLFALGLLIAGIARKQSSARYAGIALLSIALIKLFFHDLPKLGTLYLIGAFIAVAVIAFLASFAYQRFLPGNEKSPKP